MTDTFEANFDQIKDSLRDGFGKMDKNFDKVGDQLQDIRQIVLTQSLSGRSVEGGVTSESPKSVQDAEGVAALQARIRELQAKIVELEKKQKE